VNFAIQAANVPGADVAALEAASPGAREKRQFGFIKKAIKGTYGCLIEFQTPTNLTTLYR
jgi:hypothetical protein